MGITLRQVEAGDMTTIKSWLTNENNNIWLDSVFRENVFDDTRIAIMLMKKSNKTYIYEAQGKMAGVIGLTNIDMNNRSGMLWYVLGEKVFAMTGITTEAAKIFTKMCFNEFCLHSINAWSVIDNKASCRILEKNGFKLIGRQRECHYVGNIYKDRLLFDITIEDFNKLSLLSGYKLNNSNWL